MFPKLQDPGPVVLRKRKELAESLSKTSITEDGVVSDFSQEIRAGFVALVTDTDEQRMDDSVMLTASGRYTANHPSEIGDGVVHIPLSTFIEAHNNPVMVRDEEDLDRALEDRGVPKRLIVDFAWIDTDLMVKGLKDAILFSDD